MYIDYKIEIGGLLHAVGPPLSFCRRVSSKSEKHITRDSPKFCVNLLGGVE